ncbi:MAG: diguanylate cyclase [Actinomycetes bacterium]
MNDNSFAAHPPRSKPRILIAEDSRTQAAWLAHVLTRNGYQVTVTSDGMQALESIRGDPPDLVISDIAMPNMNGYELCRTIKSDPSTRRLLVMLATSLTDPGDVIRGLAAGADNFLSKPLVEEVLVARIRHMIAWQWIGTEVPDKEAAAVSYDREWYEIPADSRSSIHFLVSAIHETDRRNRMLEEATRNAEEAVKRISELESGLRNLIEQGAQSICVLDGDGMVLYGNHAACELFGRPLESCVGKPFPVPIDEPIAEVVIARPDGSVRSCELRLSSTHWHGQEAILASLWDVTDDVMIRDELKSLSATDELTGLLNRRGFFAQAEQQLNRVSAAGATSKGVSLLFLDIDSMKAINDVNGHDVGDAALIEVADLLRDSCRGADVIARLGGDEFVALLIDCNAREQALVKSRIESALTARSADPRQKYRLSASVGAAELAPGQPGSLEDLIRAADEQMYAAKQRKGRARA